MTVVEAYVCGKKINPPDDRSAVPPTVLSLLYEGVGLNTTGSIFVPRGGGAGAAEISGSPTEKAILQWAVNLGMNFDSVQSEASIIHAFPFNSEKKRGGVAVKLHDSEVHLHWKGAAEIVLSCCTSFIDENGSVVPLGDDKPKILPVVQNQHLLLCTVLICNAGAMEALPIFLDSLITAWGAVLISVTLILLFGEVE